MSDFFQASARTSVLTNSYLLHFVFLYLWSDYPERFKLARCATVCREFHEPVIRILWKRLEEDFFPLWHLFAPPDTKFHKRYSFFDKPEIDRAHYLHQVITLRLYEDPAVWKRFLWHAIHVRYITYNTDTGNDQSKIHAAHLVLMQNLLMKNGGQTFLPLLQSIRWNATSVPIDKSFAPFFTSTLRCATMTLESDDEEAHGLLLHRMQNASPHLQKIEIHSTHSWTEDSDLVVGPRLIQELLAFGRLRELGVYDGHLQPALILDFITKPNLTSFRIEGISGPLRSSWPILVNDLLEFSIEGTGPILVGLFNLLRFEVLQSVTIEVEDSPIIEQETIDVLEAFYKSLPTPSTVRSFTLKVTVWGSKETEGTSTSLRDLVHPILPLRDIHSFKYDNRLPHQCIELADIATLTTAWPKLESLAFTTGDPSDPYAYAIPVDAIHYIHAHCPHLQELQMYSIRLPVVGVHAIPAPLDHSAQSKLSPPHALRRLWIERAWVYRSKYHAWETEHTEAFARYFLELFPAVDMEEYREYREQVRQAGWGQRNIARPAKDGMELLVCMYQHGKSEAHTSRAPN